MAALFHSGDDAVHLLSLIHIFSEDGRIAMVNNGIIENYMEIKEHLIKQGVTFVSDTDSEVVAQLLEFHYNECHNMLEAVGRCLRRIEGSYALGIICADYPNALIAARKDSPLILGYGKNGNFIASDVTAVIKYTRDVAYMNDGEIAVITADSIDAVSYTHLPHKICRGRQRRNFTPGV